VLLNRNINLGPQVDFFRGVPLPQWPISHLRVAYSASTKGWQRPFDDPIPLPGGRQLVTLQDAGDYITKLPKSEHTAPEW